MSLSLRQKLKARWMSSDIRDRLPPRTWEHIVCGLHSGFPLCCIAWFLSPGRVAVCWLRDFVNSDGTEYVLMSDGTVCAHPNYYLHRPLVSVPFDDGRTLISPGYVRCPRCQILDRRVEVKDCHHPEYDDLEIPKEVEVLEISPSRIKAAWKLAKWGYGVLKG